MTRTRNASTNSLRQKGFSLIELMVAMALGLLVVGAIIQLFIGSRATQMSTDALARSQENSRFAIELLKREFRSVGTQPFCALNLEIQSHLAPTGNSANDALFNLEHPIVGWDYKGTSRGEEFTLSEAGPGSGAADWVMKNRGVTFNLPGFLDGKVAKGSDVVSVRWVEPVAGRWAESSGEDTVTLNENHGLPSGALALVTDCQTLTRADLFQNTGTGKDLAFGAGGSMTPGNHSGARFADGYGESMQLYRIHSNIYFVGYSEDREQPGLYRARISEGLTDPVIEELVSGVETMQVLYGYAEPRRDGGDGQTVSMWLSANEVPDWRFVIGAQLGLLSRSDEGMGDGATQRTFNLADTGFTHPEDRRLRQPFHTSVSLRNRQMLLEN